VPCPFAQGHNKQTYQSISTLTILNADDKQGSCEYQLLKSFGLMRQKIEHWCTDYEANAQPLGHAPVNSFYSFREI